MKTHRDLLILTETHEDSQRLKETHTLDFWLQIIPPNLDKGWLLSKKEVARSILFLVEILKISQTHILMSVGFG